MPEQLTEIYKNFRDGYLLRDAQVGAVRAFRLAGLFPKQGIDTKKINIIRTTPIDKYIGDNRTGKQKKVAKGAKARRVIGKAETADGLVLTHYEMQLVLESDLLNDPSFNIQDEIKSLAYVLGNDIETEVYNAAVANAKIAVDPDVDINGKWGDPATTLEHIISDVTEFEAAAEGTPYELNWFAYGNRANVELTKKCGVSVEDYKIPQNEFVISKSKNFMAAQHFYGGSAMGAGEVLGGDLNNPGMRIFYQNPENAKVKQAPLPEGMNDKFAPMIKMLMYDNSDTETDPQTFVKVSTTVGAYPIQKGAGLFRYADITV